MEKYESPFEDYNEMVREGVCMGVQEGVWECTKVYGSGFGSSRVNTHLIYSPDSFPWLTWFICPSLYIPALKWHILPLASIHLLAFF